VGRPRSARNRRRPGGARPDEQSDSGPFHRRIHPRPAAAACRAVRTQRVQRLHRENSGEAGWQHRPHCRGQNRPAPDSACFSGGPGPVTVSAASATAEVPAPVTLTRRLGPIDASAIVISNVIGGGIFFVPVLVARLTPSAWAMLGVWLFGGLLAFAGAMAYAELATLRPRAGGEYVYLRAAFGSGAAFLSGWTSFVAGFSGAIAAGAVALADCIGRFVPAAGNRTALLPLSLPHVRLPVTPQAIVAISAIAAFSTIHLHGSGRIVHNLLAGLKVSA